MYSCLMTGGKKTKTNKPILLVFLVPASYPPLIQVAPLGQHLFDIKTTKDQELLPIPPEVKHSISMQLTMQISHHYMGEHNCFETKRTNISKQNLVQKLLTLHLCLDDIFCSETLHGKKKNRNRNRQGGISN